MITPAIRGGHEVCTPVYVEGAEVGDAIAIRIKDIAVTSQATSSGNDQAMEGRFNGDPYCAAVCPGLRRRVAGDAARGHRRDRDPLRRLRRRRDALHVHQRLHGGVRRPARGHRRRGPRAGATPATLRPPPRCPTTRSRTRSSPSPRTTSSGSSRACGRSSASSARRRRRRCPTPTTPATSARSSSARRTSSRSTARRCSSTRPTGTWTSTPCARARRSSARSRSPAAASTSATCTRCRATARSPATPRTSREP